MERLDYFMPATVPPESSSPTDSVSVVRSEDLFQLGQELVIVHRGTPYRLRITRQDKLILTK